MNTVSSSSDSSTKTYSYSSNGLSGLFSGLDTESMVKKMLSGTQTKIDKQNQQKQILTWKQEMYRTAIKDINTFKSKYFDSAFDSTLKTNLCSSDFFNAKVSTVSSGSAVTVKNTDPSADVGTMSFNVQQLAKAARLDSDVQMSSGQSITGSKVDFEKLAKALEGGDISFDISLDGVTKQLTLSKSDGITKDNFESVLKDKTEAIFGGYVTASVSNDQVTFAVGDKYQNEAGHELVITGADVSTIGITPGSSSRLSGFTKLGDLMNISGGAYSFSINGQSFTFLSTDTVSTMIGKINSSNAGVRLSYSSATDKFSLETTSTGEQYGIEIQQSTGNLMSVLFGAKVANGASVSGNKLNTTTLDAKLDKNYTTSKASLSMNVNGTNYTFSYEPKDAFSRDDLQSSLNSWLKDTFGTQSDGSTNNISYDISTGKFTTAADYNLSFTKTGVAATDSSASSNLAVAMGLAENGASNAVTGDTKISDAAGLSEMTLLDKDGNVLDHSTAKLSDIAQIKDGDKTYATSFNSTSGSLVLTPGESDNATISFTDPGVKAYFGETYTPGTGVSSGTVAGKDLLISINGTQTSRSSNTFAIDGLTITAKALSGDTDTTVDTTLDTNTVVSSIKSFVSDYNTLISGLYGKITEDYTYKDYAPLTDAQKAEMSESQITAWEAKSKTGLLRNDSTISSFLQSMETSFYTTVKDAGIAAYSIGIETISTDLSGKLTLDESALTNALATNPEAVAKLFTDSTSGLATMLSQTIDRTAKLSAASPGTLVQIAGADGWTTNAKTNDIYRELQSINDKLDELKDKYDNEKERYWNKFNSMEAAIANYQSQSAMLTSSFSSSS